MATASRASRYDSRAAARSCGAPTPTRAGDARPSSSASASSRSASARGEVVAESSIATRKTPWSGRRSATPPRAGTSLRSRSSAAPIASSTCSRSCAPGSARATSSATRRASRKPSSTSARAASSPSASSSSRCISSQRSRPRSSSRSRRSRYNTAAAAPAAACACSTCCSLSDSSGSTMNRKPSSTPCDRSGMHSRGCAPIRSLAGSRTGPSACSMPNENAHWAASSETPALEDRLESRRVRLVEVRAVHDPADLPVVDRDVAPDVSRQRIHDRLQRTGRSHAHIVSAWAATGKRPRRGEAGHALSRSVGALDLSWPARGLAATDATGAASARIERPPRQPCHPAGDRFWHESDRSESGGPGASAHAVSARASMRFVEIGHIGECCRPRRSRALQSGRSAGIRYVSRHGRRRSNAALAASTSASA